MAGIGFELRRILNRGTYASEIRAYLYAALVSSGPWLMSILCLSILGAFRGATLTKVEHEVFRSTIIYTYAFTLIYIGGLQLVTTRYLADQFYLGRQKWTLRTFFTTSVLVLVPGTPLVAAIYAFFPLDPLYRGMAVVLFNLVCLIWLAMIFLSAVKDYMSIVLAFIVGTGVSIAGAFSLGHFWGQNGFLLGYVAGQAVTLFWLLARLLAEFPAVGLWDRELFAYFGRYWELAVIGLAYNLAIWVDKFIFWTAPDARLVAPYFWTHDAYEGPIFFAYLTIVPTLAIFLMRIETVFYEHYRGFYAKVLGQKPYAAITQEKERMKAALRKSLREVCIIQGTLTLLCLAFADGIADMARLIPLQVPILRIGLVGAFLQALLSIEVVILFYFDLRRRVLALSLFFLLSNAGLSWLSIQLGTQYYGYGYCYSCLLTLALGYRLLSSSVEELEYITFARQPLG